jgi:hypothetical protein
MWRRRRPVQAAGHVRDSALLAYNSSREGKSALLACAEIASFAHSETHLLAVAGMPSSMFLTEGFLPEELLEEEKKRAQEVLNEGIAQLKQKGFSVAGHLRSASRWKRSAASRRNSSATSSWSATSRKPPSARAGGADR